MVSVYRGNRGGESAVAVIGPSGALPQTWEQCLSDWMTWLRIGGKRETTVRLRTDHVRAIARRSGTRHPGEITLNMLIGLCSERRWSNEHRKGVRTSLIGFYGWAVQTGLVADNPAALLPKVMPSTPQPRPAPDGVWADLIAAAPPRERLMALLAGEAGLRRAEVACAHTNDLLHTGDGWSLVVHGKGGRQRVVPLTDRLASEIRLYCPPHGGFLFPGQIDGHISAAWAGTVISKLMPDGWAMHTLRHRFATRGYAGTGNLRAVQEALGHASVATTQRYTAVAPREVRSVAEAAASHAAEMPVAQ